MTDQEINIEAVLTVAEGLGELNEEVVFVGGAVLGLYAKDEGVDEDTRDPSTLIQDN